MLDSVHCHDQDVYNGSLGLDHYNPNWLVMVEINIANEKQIEVMIFEDWNQ